MSNVVFVIHRPTKQVLAAGLRTFIIGGGGASGVGSFNSRTGAVTLSGSDVTTALGYLPANNASLAAVALSGSYADLSSKPAIPSTAAEVGAATVAQGAKADSAVQPATLTGALSGKVDKDGVKVLSDQNYTVAEKTKLAGIEAAHFKGLHASLAALQAAHPSAVAGNYADVDSGVGSDVARYIWDVSDSKWIIQSGASGSMTAAQIKTSYESNPDTNGYSDAEQAKLGAIAAGATANASDSALRDRANHSGAQAASTISDFAATVRATVLTGLSLTSGAAITAADSALAALGKLQKQINDLFSGKQDTLVSGTNLKTVNGNSLLGSGNIAIAGAVQRIPVACSDETTALTAGTAKVTFRMQAFTLSGVAASLTTAQASGSILTVDVNVNGTSILSTKLTLDNTEKTSSTAAIAAVISSASIPEDAEVTIDLDQIGGGTAKGLKVYLIGVPA